MERNGFEPKDLAFCPLDPGGTQWRQTPEVSLDHSSAC